MNLEANPFTIVSNDINEGRLDGLYDSLKSLAGAFGYFDVIAYDRHPCINHDDLL